MMRIFVLSTVALLSASVVEAQEWRNLNVIVLNGSTPIPGAVVTIDQDFGNGLSRTADGGGFTNFGVHLGATVSWVVTANGFAAGYGSATISDHHTAYIGLTPSATSFYMPPVTTVYAEGYTMKFHNNGSTEWNIRGWVEAIRTDTAFHSWAYVDVDRTTGAHYVSPVSYDGNPFPESWQPYLNGNPNWLGTMGAPTRYYFGIPCNNGSALAGELGRKNAEWLSHAIIGALPGFINSGGTLTPAILTGMAGYLFIRNTWAIAEFYEMCHPL